MNLNQKVTGRSCTFLLLLLLIPILPVSISNHDYCVFVSDFHLSFCISAFFFTCFPSAYLDIYITVRSQRAIWIKHS